MAARSFLLNVSTNVKLIRKDFSVDEGVWSEKGKLAPQERIAKYGSGRWGSESNGFMSGTGGRVVYTSDRGDIGIHWTNPYMGGNEVRVTYDSSKLSATVSDYSGNNAQVHISIDKPERGSKVRDSLAPGQRLNIGEQLASENGRVFLAMQDGGNLVLYRSDRRLPLWTAGSYGDTFAIMQNDGNFVVYRNSDGRIGWACGRQIAGSRLIVEDDGNVILYSPQNEVIWASNTVQDWKDFDTAAAAELAHWGANPLRERRMPNSLASGESLTFNQKLVSDNGKFFLIMQPDGNLVLYRSSDRKALWATHTVDRGKSLSMEHNGNLVFQGANNGAGGWWIPNRGHDCRCVLQDDGQLVILNKEGGSCWTVVSSRELNLT